MSETVVLLNPEKFPEKRVNHVRRIPFGYCRKEGDPYLLVPISELCNILDEGFQNLNNGRSTREVAEWIEQETGEHLSHTGLIRLWNYYYPKERAKKTKVVLKAYNKNKIFSREELKQRELRKKVAAEKRRITNAKKRALRMLEDVKGIDEDINTAKALVASSVISEVDYSSYQDLTKEQETEVAFKPNPGPQTEFFESTELEVLYGGQAGGGKSYAIIADPMRYFNSPHFNGIILRRTSDALRELISKQQYLYEKVFGDTCKWSEKKSSWKLPGGGSLWMTYLERDDDVLRYQGQAFTYIAFDELTQYPTPYPWNYMRSRLRTASEGNEIDLVMRATTNPGGPGHGWVKRMFIDPAPPNTPFPATDIDTNEVMVYPEDDYEIPENLRGKPLFERKFIPAKLADNPSLNKDPRYRANLHSMPEHLKRQLLEGDWSIAEGAAFPEFRTSQHVIKPFVIPPDWKRFRSCDYGYSTWAAVHWYAIDPTDETLVVYRELYATKHTGRDLAQRILELEQGERISYGVLDSSVWRQTGMYGPTVAEEMNMMGCRWRPSDRSGGSRAAGKNRLHELLKLRPVGRDMQGNDVMRPGIQFFDTCRQIIADLPVIPTHPKGEDDIDDRYSSDHAYDSIRYGVMSRPRSKSPFDDWGTSNQIQSYRPVDPIFGY